MSNINTRITHESETPPTISPNDLSPASSYILLYTYYFEQFYKMTGWERFDTLEDLKDSESYLDIEDDLEDVEIFKLVKI